MEYASIGNLSFKGNFVNPGIIDKAVKKSKKDLIHSAKTGSIRLTQADFDNLDQKGQEIKDQFTKIASELPDDIDLKLYKNEVLSSYGWVKAFTAGLKHPLLGEEKQCASNKRHYDYNSDYNLDCLSDSTKDMSTQEVLTSFVDRRQTSLQDDFRFGHTGKAREKIGILTSLAEQDGTYNHASRVKSILESALNERLTKEENKKANLQFLAGNN
ncbi:hypothetical protein II906_05280 [bacterium]|nr:hypothetical protein [bacterium]